jgi:hypothetical protein
MLGIKDDVSYTFMEVWSAVHEAIERYNKWEQDRDVLEWRVIWYLVNKVQEWKITVEEFIDMHQEWLIALNNFLNAGYERIESEVPSSADIWLPFPLMAIADWLPVGQIVDYKIVWQFFDPEQQPDWRTPVTTLLQYTIQARENALILKHHGKEVNQVVFIEILKSDGTPPKSMQKWPLIDLIKSQYWEDVDLKNENWKDLTIDQLREKFNPKTDTVREYVFNVTDERLAEWYTYLENIMTEMDAICESKWAK